MYCVVPLLCLGSQSPGRGDMVVKSRKQQTKRFGPTDYTYAQTILQTMSMHIWGVLTVCVKFGPQGLHPKFGSKSLDWQITYIRVESALVTYTDSRQCLRRRVLDHKACIVKFGSGGLDRQIKYIRVEGAWVAQVFCASA